MAGSGIYVRDLRNPEIKTPPHIRNRGTDLDRVRKCVDGLLGRLHLQQTRSC